jgi:hypothetical protein
MYFPVLDPIREFFSQAQWGGADVVTVFAAPDRAHTQASRVFAKRSGLTRQQVEDQPTPVPFMSIWRSHPLFDPTRDSRAVIRGINRDLKAGTALKMRFPQPQVSDIQVDLWCGEAGGKIAEVVAAQIDILFPAESVYLPIDWSLEKWYKPPFDVFEHAKVYGQTRGRLVRSQGWTDNTNLEYAAGNKEVRLSWQGRYEFYLPYKPEEGRIVRDLVIDIFDQDSNALLETLNVSAED